MHEQNRSTVELLPFDAARDLEQLGVWVHRPHVARWWGDPDLVLAAVRQHSSTDHAFITVDTTPVGYLCWQRPPPHELEAAGLSDLPTGLIDVDILIGEQDFVGRGVGPRALSLLCDRLRGEGHSHVGMAGAVANSRAVKAYEKAGFRLFRAFRENGEDMQYLVRSLQ